MLISKLFGCFRILPLFHSPLAPVNDTVISLNDAVIFHPFTEKHDISTVVSENAMHPTVSRDLLKNYLEGSFFQFLYQIIFNGLFVVIKMRAKLFVLVTFGTHYC